MSWAAHGTAPAALSTQRPISGKARRGSRDSVQFCFPFVQYSVFLTLPLLTVQNWYRIMTSIGFSQWLMVQNLFVHSSYLPQSLVKCGGLSFVHF